MKKRKKAEAEPKSDEEETKPPREKVTLYLGVDQIRALENIRFKRIDQGVKRGEVDKSSLMREAVDMLIEKEKKE